MAGRVLLILILVQEQLNVKRFRAGDFRLEMRRDEVARVRSRSHDEMRSGHVNVKARPSLEGISIACITRIARITSCLSRLESALPGP